MNKPKFFKVLSTLAVSTLLLSACGGNGESTKTSTQKKVETSKFATLTKNDKKEIQDGSLTYGLVSDTPFGGILNRVVYEKQPDWEIISIFDDSLLWTDKNWEINNEGPATFKISEDEKTITISIKDNVKWHDGNPVTAEDLEFAYLTIGHPKYEGARYSKQMPLIEGMEDYHAGKADKISGVKVIDPKTISITYKAPNPSMKTGIWATPLHKKYLGDVPVEKLAESDKVRKNPIGFGPFKVKKIVPGEAVEFERFDDYWGGKPKLKNITLKVVNPSVVNASLKNGDIDIAEVTADQYPNVSKLKNTQLIGQTDLYYSYIGFKFGRFDKDKKESVMDNDKFKEVKLRQAMAYAIDRKEIGDKLYHGLRFPANSPIPPSLPKFHNNKVGAYDKDLEKAKKLLDEAGYKDKNGDGFREDPQGKEFKVNFLAMSGSDTSEPLAKHFIQSWKDIGLKAELVDGRLHEFNSFYDMIENDDPKVDVFSGAWGTGSDPDPSGIWAKGAKFNNGRWVNDENTKLLEEGISAKAMDDKYRTDVYNKWQKLIHDEVPLIPLHYKFELKGINNRVKNYDIAPGAKLTWKDVTVTSDKAETEK
ncbi:oligopeptide ABC transporter substrate-binding protein [Bacillus anthracis]|uniref:oligopeptide ABC transporter substrate-binding protein n=1 Tax=Bacillus cereus group TaxID=86661 RepID=UPI003D23A0C9